MPAARIGDLCAHGGAITGPGCPTVLIGMMPAARVTDIIFKVQSGAGEQESRVSPTRVSTAHADATGAGFAGAAADHAAAMRAQNTNGKVETIRRAKPRVKRNEPCPCGSGKKYKLCHGRQ